ncbi:3'(2'),5'-bisphosphate nucleotidase CysQ [Campylobacter blaseri]|uniref:3'(2'),5'-bisphosphate nucleotidase CysQ n=2 Tax=Campylobacter blaseri TaxID=2042961 RepID=A0A2P8R495_9BACT|nr:3'(2'),5'-bisphosphate nucleotidase CysQ [Campylobacter blaseri]PSM54783.1 3'(2'),5'-bisphosphate nucleotidase CysQ [Campylobacter blaseri]
MNELLESAILASKNASKEILNHYSNYSLYAKDDKSPLTSADLAANDEIFKVLEKTDIPICSEESILPYEQREKLEEFWLIDPLDGTKEFIAKNGEFCICIALIKNGKPILGVINIPIKDEIYYSNEIGKVYKNENLLNFSSNSPNLHLTGRNGKKTKSSKFANYFNLTQTNLGSAIKFCKLASNEASAYARFGDSSLWDIAAGHFLVKASGGLVIDLKTKQDPIYNGKSLINNHFLALNKNSIHLKDKMVDYIKKYIAI